MNLARFELLKDQEGKIVPDGVTELVEISEKEALKLPRDAYKVETVEELSDLSISLGASRVQFLSENFGDSNRGNRRADPQDRSIPIPPRRHRKYVKHEKKTSKEFVEKMKKTQGLFDLDGSILDMGPKELLAHFPRKKKAKEIDKNHFARNVVWHFYREILAGRPPEFVVDGCNMRTIFYILKPIFTQNRVFDDIDSFYGNFAKAFQKLVIAGLLSYKDFNIMDDRKVFRFLPDAAYNTHILLLAEKKAYVGRFSALASKYGVMSQITNGRSTILMTDTMLTEMFELGYDLNKNLNILSFCDFDPVGTSIPYHFTKHLKTLGFHNVNEFTQYGEGTLRRKDGRKKNKDGTPKYLTIYQQRPALDIVNPHDLDTATRQRMRHVLKASIRDNISTADWAFITGGVTGTGRNKEYAISSEQFLPYVTEHLEAKIRPLLEMPPEEVGLQAYLKFLHKAIREYIGTRAERDAMKKLDS